MNSELHLDRKNFKGGFVKQILNWRKATVSDVEADDLLKGATKIHVLALKMAGKDAVKWIGQDNLHERLGKFLQHHINHQIPLVMHNGIGYDVPLLEKILEIDLSELMLIDTLALSWYLNYDRKIHGLDSFFEDYGIAKPKIVDWENLSFEEYLDRCVEDVKINSALWQDLMGRLIEMYTHSKEAIDAGLVGGTRLTPDEEIYLDQFVGQSVDEHINRLLTFLMSKMDFARLQEKTRWEVDVEYLQATHDELDGHIEQAKGELEVVMPKVPKYTPRKKPAKPYKMNGELSASGEKWEEIKDLIRTKATDGNGHLLVLTGFGEDGQDVKVLKDYEPPNVNSSKQIKDFLYSKGWKPITFKFVRDKVEFQRWIDAKPSDGSPRLMWSSWKDARPKDRMVPQVSVEGDEGKELCPSVVELEERVPEIGAYSKYTTIKSRLDVIKGFLATLEDGRYLKARIGGFTNTLRVKHRELVNLPGADKPYGEQVRGCLIAGEGRVSMGSDLSSLEDRVKHHFMLPHDPDYVATMMEDDFDPHILMAMSAHMITEEEYHAFKAGVKPEHVLKARKAGKATNYASVYNAGPPTIARAAGVPDAEGKQLHEGYWKLNWSVKAIAEEQYVFDDSRGGKWLVNPVNGFCYSLRKESDRFSTLCQGTGSYLFDVWVDNIQTAMEARHGVKRQSGAFHDECIICVKDNQKARDSIEEITYQAIKDVNTEFQLRRDLGCDVCFGYRYSEIH